MTVRLPNPRYIGDGLYVRHDGGQLVPEASDGHPVLNRIIIDESTLESIREYTAYIGQLYRTEQIRAGPGCDACGADITSAFNPIAGAVRGEVYHLEIEDMRHEVRLCRDCAPRTTVDRITNLIEQRKARNNASTAA